MSAARANVQEFSAKVSKSVAAVGVASALLASVRLAAPRYAISRWGDDGDGAREGERRRCDRGW